MTAAEFLHFRRLAGSCLYGLAVTLLVGLCYGAYWAGTYFSQDCFVWLCFAKFYETPQDLLFRNTLAGQFFRPVGEYWWLAVHAFAGDRVRAYQLAFLAVHFLNAGLASWLGLQIAGRGVGRVIFVLFALNPIFVAPVSNYYHYNFDTLGLAFYLSSLLLLSSACRRGNLWGGLLSLFTAVAAYFSKEAYFTLPAAAVLVIGVSQPGARWSAREVWRRRGWLAAHTVVCAVAWGWRWVIIGRFGGYGLAEIDSTTDWVGHIIERGSTLAGFAGWSMVPACERWYGVEFFPLLCSVALLGLMTWRCWTACSGPSAVWCWSWIVVLWLPSMIMTTYAAVSFYPPLFGSVLLVAQVLRRWPFGSSIGLVIGTYYAIHGWAFFHDRAPYIDELRRQHAALRVLFPVESWASGENRRIILLDGEPDLFPDAVVKYAAPPATSMSSILIFNAAAPTNWVITNANDLLDIRPLVVSRTYQDGYMQMPPYRVYPLELDPNTVRLNQQLEALTVLRWDGNGFREITAVQKPPGQPEK